MNLKMNTKTGGSRAKGVGAAVVCDELPLLEFAAGGIWSESMRLIRGGKLELIGWSEPLSRLSGW